MKKITKSMVSLLTLFVVLVFISSSYAGTYYRTYKNGVPVYTNIPPVEGGYKRIVIQNQVYDVRRNSIEKFTYSKNYDDQIYKTAKWYGIDPYLVKAVIKVESNFNPGAVSPKGAIGVMQLMPETARDHGVNNPFNPSENISGGVKYLKKLIDMFNGDLRLALAGYNAGENAVVKSGYMVPPYNETMDYVDKVLVHYNHLKNSIRDETDKRVVSIDQTKADRLLLAKHLPASSSKMDKSEPETTKRIEKEDFPYDKKLLILETEKSERAAKADSPAAVSSDGKFTIQIASFPELEEAQRMEQSLKLKSFPAFIQRTDVPGKGTWYRVRVGSFSTREEARLYGETIKNNEPSIGAVLITLNK